MRHNSPPPPSHTAALFLVVPDTNNYTGTHSYMINVIIHTSEDHVRVHVLLDCIAVRCQLPTDIVQLHQSIVICTCILVLLSIHLFIKHDSLVVPIGDDCYAKNTDKSVSNLWFVLKRNRNQRHSRG